MQFNQNHAYVTEPLLETLVKNPFFCALDIDFQYINVSVGGAVKQPSNVHSLNIARFPLSGLSYP